MIDHTGVTVTDVAKSKAFYRAALAPLGYALIMEWEQFAGFGVRAQARFLDRRGRAERAADPRRVSRRHARAGRRVLQGGDGRRRPRQRAARPAAALPRELLRRVRARSGRPQHRSGLPLAAS